MKNINGHIQKAHQTPNERNSKLLKTQDNFESSNRKITHIQGEAADFSSVQQRPEGSEMACARYW